MFDAIKFFTTEHGKKDDKEEKKSFFERKKYTEDQKKKINDWVSYYYVHNNFIKWNHKIYMQVFEWALNDHLPKEIRDKAQSLTVAYITYMVTNGGKRKLPTNIVQNLNKFYKRGSDTTK